MCDNCDNDGYTAELCVNCNGSGEGQADGTICYVCRGYGTVNEKCDCECCENEGNQDYDDYDGGDDYDDSRADYVHEGYNESRY